MRDRLIQKLIFRLKIKDTQLIDEIKSLKFYEDLLLIQYVISMPEPQTLKECHNQFIWIKRVSKLLLKIYFDACETIKDGKDELKNIASIINDKSITAARYYSFYDKIINILENNILILNTYKSCIITLNNKLLKICCQYDYVDLPFRDFIPLVGINMKTAEKYIQESTGHINKKVSKHYFYLYDGIEDARTECFKYNPNGMPLFNLTTESTLIAIEKNSAIKKKVRDYLIYDMGFGQHMYVEKVDKDGNITFEKYYPAPKVVKYKGEPPWKMTI